MSGFFYHFWVDDFALHQVAKRLVLLKA